MVPAKSHYIVGVRIKKAATPVVLDFEVLNLLVRPNQGMEYQRVLKDREIIGIDSAYGRILFASLVKGETIAIKILLHRDFIL